MSAFSAARKGNRGRVNYSMNDKMTAICQQGAEESPLAEKKTCPVCFLHSKKEGKKFSGVSLNVCSHSHLKMTFLILTHTLAHIHTHAAGG